MPDKTINTASPVINFTVRNPLDTPLEISPKDITPTENLKTGTNP